MTVFKLLKCKDTVFENLKSRLIKSSIKCAGKVEEPSNELARAIKLLQSEFIKIASTLSLNNANIMACMKKYVH